MAGPELDFLSTIALLDELAANAWPAPVQQQLEGWRLRAAGGLTRRANSVYTAGPVPGYQGWMREARDFYARHGLPVRFQVSDGSPPELGYILDHLGYSHEAHSEVHIAHAAVAAKSELNRQVLVETASRMDDSWLEAFIQVEGHDPALAEKYRAIISAIGPAARFARAQVNGAAVGVGMAVSERGWTGLFNMATAKEMRGQGIATAIISDLARWSLQKGADRLYLQVMGSNEAAMRLYARRGFNYLYGYHYRTQPEGN